MKKNSPVPQASSNAKVMSVAYRNLNYSVSLVIILIATFAINRIIMHYSQSILHGWGYDKLKLLQVLLIVTFIVSIVALLLIFSVKFSIRKYGIKRSVWLFNIYRSLDKQLVDAKLYSEYASRANGQKLAKTPKIQLQWLDSEQRLIVQLKSSLQLSEKLLKLNISPALKDFVLENCYSSEDNNWIIYECYQVNIDTQIIAQSLDEFKHVISNDQYTVTVDKNLEYELHHSMLVGQTGSGKSYSLYSYVLQGLLKDWNMYIADPKATSMSIIGEMIGNSACSVEEILSLLETFDKGMQQRKMVLRARLHEGLDLSYSDFHMKPNVFMFDEYASFIQSLKVEKKDVRDKAMKIITNIILEGRQLGCFIILALQKSDADIVNTLIRDQMIFKCVLGDSEDLTYVTTFGQGALIPNAKMTIGRGIYTLSGKANIPSLCSMPRLSFDIYEAIKSLTTTKKVNDD